MPHTASPYSTEDKAVMTGIQEYKESSIYGTAIHTNPPVGYNIASANNASSSSDSKVKSQYNHPNSSYERKVDVKRDDDALGLVRAIEALSVKEKKAGIKAAEAVNKITSPKRAAKAAKTSKTTFARTFLELGRKKKASAPDAPSRRPRSSLGDQHRRVELFGYLGGEVPAKVVRRRKPLPSANKDPLCMTLHRSGRTAGAVPSSYPGEIVNPIKNDLMSMWAEGRTLGHSDNNGARMATLSRYKSWNGLDYV
ncbi:hypothetical protein FRC00_009606 [Tulasnella sp. 408]|nr:hypothetical protein FRC00_009606 [Tulasnella sp. 408]